MAENKKRKKYFAIWVAAAIVFILIGALVSFIVSSKFAERVSRVFSDLNPFKPEGKPDDGGGSNLSKGTNATAVETTTAGSGGGGAVAEEVVYGSGRLDILNKINYNSYGSQDIKVLHRTGASEGYDIKDGIYYGMFNPSGFKAKIVSNISGYELEIDSRPVDSLSTIYLELAMHSQSGGAIAINSTNELRLGFVSSTGIGDFDDFSGKTLTIQQYNPSNASASYPAYDVRDVIDDGGVITLANLSGSYDSEVPYAWFRVEFS